MAEVITRLIVDSQDYDNKIKRAAQGLQHYADACRKAGGTLEYVEEEVLAFARDLGKMDTAADSARQQVREYTNAISSLTATYQQMTAEEKSSKFGKAMAASIEQLKQRAADLQKVIRVTNRELQNLSQPNQFTAGISMMTRTIGACTAAITAWTGSSKEMDALLKDLAKIGTTVAAVDQLTQAFQKQNLVLLKNPYVWAAAGAVALVAALAKVIQSTQVLTEVQKDLNDVERKGREDSAREVTRINALNNILQDNTRSLEERKAALSEIQSLVPDYHGALTTEGNLVNNNTTAIDNYIASLQRAAMAQAAFDRMVDLQKQKMEAQLNLEKKQAYLDRTQKTPTESLLMAGVAGSSGEAAAMGLSNVGDVAIAEAAVRSAEREVENLEIRITSLLKLINSSDLVGSGGTGSGKSSSVAKSSTGSGFSVNSTLSLPEAGSLADLERQAALVRNSMGGATTSEEYAEMQAQLDGILDRINKIKGASEEAFASGSLKDLQKKLQDAQDNLNSLTPGTKEWSDALKVVQERQAAVNDLQKQMQVQVKETVDAMDQFKEGVDAVGDLVGAMSSLQNVGEDLVEVFRGEKDAWDSVLTVMSSGISILQTVITIYEAINALKEISNMLSKQKAANEGLEAAATASAASTEAAAEATKAGASLATAGADAAQGSAAAGKAVAGIPVVGPILAVAAIATVLGVVLGAISKAKSAGKFATGGIVPGNYYNDELTANVSSGELILNRAQQGVIAGQLAASNPMGNMTLEADLSGEIIRLALQNNGSRRGGSRNEYAITKFG